MNVRPLVWDEKLVIKFWDYYSQYPELYFTYQFGGNIANVLSQYVKPGDAVLDYGCGTGFIIKHFINKGFETYGADTSSQSVEFVNKQYKGKPNFKGAYLLDDLFRLSRKFDVIFVVEVIEHLSDEFLVPLVENVKKLGNSGSKIIFTTPNNERLSDAVVYCPVCEHTFHRWQHVRSWNVESLTSFMKKHGLKVDNCFATDFSDVPPDGVLKKFKHSARNFFYTASQPHLVAICNTKG
jgi:2-polyprenyl-3-methyl-5-hydroxy-6-metoxy-1,4-benzoquinol methylase